MPNQAIERATKTKSAKPTAARTPSARSVNSSKTPSRARAKEDAIEVAGVRISHPDKVLYPKSGVTKGDVARYYEAIADLVLPQLVDRPLTLVRAPDGVEKQKFYQKHAGPHAPPSLHTLKIAGDDEPYVYVDDLEGLLSLVQLGALELHTWGSHRETVEKPDLVVMDLDPDEGLAWSDVVSAAREMREVLRGHLGLESWVKTTGGKGLHVVVPLAPKLAWDEVKAFTEKLARTLAELRPERYVATMSKAKRKGRVFLDYLRNGRGATAIAAYSTRAREGATVAMPVPWESIDALDPTSFTVRTAAEHVAKRRRDPWADMAKARQSVDRKSILKL